MFLFRSRGGPAARSVLLAAGLAAAAWAAPARGQERNDLISAFVDAPERFKGKTVTFRLVYVDTPGMTPLPDRVGAPGRVPFRGRDPNNGARLLLGVTVPKGLSVPRAQDGDELLVTFRCAEGKTDTGNVAVSIERPARR